MAGEAAGGFPSGWWGAGAAGLGAIADIYAFFKNQQTQEQQKKIYDILADPAKLSAYVNRWFQPMSAAENQAVQRDLGANWSVMTGGAPGGAMNQYVADALAKIENQRYQSATGTALTALTGAGGAIPGQRPMGNFGNIMQSLMILKAIKGKNGGQAASPFPPPTTVTTMPDTTLPSIQWPGAEMPELGWPK